MEKWNKKLLLEDGSQFYGYGFGSQEEKITEIVFNTAPVGYRRSFLTILHISDRCYGISVDRKLRDCKRRL